MQFKTQFTVPQKEKEIPWRAALTEFLEEEDLEVIALALWAKRKTEQKYRKTQKSKETKQTLEKCGKTKQN